MIYRSSCAYSFGKSEKKTENTLLNSSLKTPDFNKYQGEIIKKPTKGFHFSKEEKLKILIPQTPGPGKYNPNKSTFGEDAPKYSINKTEKETIIGKIIKKNKKNKYPGPGDYAITEENCEKTILNRTVSNYFSKEPKLKTIDNHIPGVGKYTNTSLTDFGKSTKNKFTMPKAKRKDIVDKYKTSSGAKNKDDIQALDPGKYEIASTFGKGGTKPLLRGKPKDLKTFNVPGPGDYESGKAKIKTLRRSPTTCLGFGNRPDITEIEIKKNVPGFKYEIKSEFDVSDVNKIKANKFGKSERMKNIINNTPGPGSYHIPCSFAVLPDYEKVTESKFRKI